MQSKDISIVICGEAGQGINTVSEALLYTAHRNGFNVFSTTEFMSRIRGGINSTEIRISEQRVRAPIDRIDIFIPLINRAYKHLQKRISQNTIIIGEIGESGYKNYEIQFSKIAREIGGPIYTNIVAVGAIVSILNLRLEYLNEYLKKNFQMKGETVVNNNLRAAQLGYEKGKELKNVLPPIDNPSGVIQENEKIMDGSEAIALGAIAGGCKFIAAYPMTPSSGVWTYLARHSNELDIITEQAEDEISAMNMGIGASYAGARSMVTTSGGGFDLMTEGLSLSAIQETPIVIHLAQRPGPATGLPTRTEQADLELALYAGHGEFPRIILAPGSFEQGFYLTQKAFNLADKYQVPVFVLTDQFFIDSSYNVAPFELDKIRIESAIIKMTRDYKRYRLTENGVSPRGIPGFGEGLVNADCHHHTEDGHISEDLELRPVMMDKLFKKISEIKNDIIPPELVGSPDYKTLVLCWGSNYNIVKEAIEDMNYGNISMLHFSQVFPIHPDTGIFLRKAKNLCIVENNATGQFAKMIKLYTDIDIKNRILKYNGLPFSVEEIIKRLEEFL
ncbi:MAG: 2-oxoacid:acceptor oxidoreductase subunit alpha [bacterium]